MAHGTVTLENRSRGIVTIELPHDICCTADKCSCTRQLHGALDYKGPRGRKRVRGGRKRIPRSVTLLARGDAAGNHMATGLPPSVVRTPSYLGQCGKLKLTELSAAETEEQAAELTKAAKARVEDAKARDQFVAAKAKRQLDAEIDTVKKADAARASEQADELKKQADADAAAAAEKAAADKAAAEKKAEAEKAAELKKSGGKRGGGKE